MENSLKIISFTREKVKEFIPDMARLRIEVFAEYPFLYAGDYEYEMRYLKKFLTMEDAIVVIAFDSNDTPIGLATGYPFRYEMDHMQKMFIENGMDPERYFCFGESVLRKSYRGQGIGKRFFEERELHVASLAKYPHICFYTSVRPKNDPNRPLDYRHLAPFWKSRGFVEHPELTTEVSYQEIGETEETPKKMVFWIK